MKKILTLIAVFLIIQSCDDKKTQQFGGVNLTISKKVISEEIEDDTDIEISFTQDDIELFPLKGKESKVKLNKNLIFNNFKIKKIDDIKPNDLLINSSENQIADVDAIRVTLNNEQPTTIPIINGSASYSRDGLSVGTIPIKVDLFGGGTNKYTQTKSVSIIANQNSSALFNSFSVVNQQISITNSSFSNTVVQGEQISFDWTNSHAERSVQISVIQDNDNNVIQVLEANYIGSSYALNTNNSNTANNIGFKVSSNIASNTSSSICCFDLVANAPQANDISSSVNEDSSVTIQLDASSPGGESVTYGIVSSPSNGSVGSISGSNVTYTPNQDFNGSDSFTYKANNGSQDSNTATVSITVNNVNDAPVVENLTTSTAYQQSVSIELNGSDIDGDNLTYFVNANPSNGTIAFSGSSTITYNPNSGFSGSDSFNYGANDGSLDSNIATVSITVEEDNSIVVTYPNGGQEFIIGQTYTLLWNNSFSNTGVELRKDGNKVLDINGDVGSATSLSWTVPSSLTTGGGYVIRVYDAGGGTEFDESDNPFTISGSSTNPTYSETNNSSILFGEDSFIELTEIDADLGKKNTSMTISLWFKAAHNPNRDVLIHGNGSTAEFGRLGFTQTGAFGKAYLRSPSINFELSGTTDFTNDRNWNHMAYVVRISDSGGFFRFYVNGVLENSNSFTGQSFNAFDRKWEIGHYTAASSSDEDFQGHIDDIAVWNVVLTDSELATIYNSGNPTLAHKVRADDLRAYYDFEDNSIDDKTGRGKNPVSSQNVTIVNDAPGNTAPTVEDISISTSFEQSVSINLLGSDADNDNLTYFVDTNPINGTVAFNGSSTIIYSPNSDFSGNDSFTYYVNDGLVDSNIATVSITTSKVNITYPVGGESLIIGAQYQLTWDGGFTNTGIELWNGEQKIVDINGDVGTANSFAWTIPSNISTGDGFFIKIYDAGNGTNFVDSNNFSIVGGSDFTFTYPNGGDQEFVIGGSSESLGWTNTNGSVKLSLQVDENYDLSGANAGWNNASWSTLWSQDGVGSGFNYTAPSPDLYFSSGNNEHHDLMNTTQENHGRYRFTIENGSGFGFTDDFVFKRSESGTYASNNSLYFDDVSTHGYADFREIMHSFGKPDYKATVSFWVKNTGDWSESGGESGVFLHNQLSDNSNTPRALRISVSEDGNNYPNVYFYGPNVNIRTNGSTTLQKNIWYHFVATIDNTNGKFILYLNGNEEINFDFTPTDFTTQSERLWQLNGFSWEPNHYTLQAYYDDFAVWRTVLSESEISQLYNSGDSMDASAVQNSDLVAYYPFESLDSFGGTHQKTYDISPFRKHGYVYGGVLSSDDPNSNRAPTTNDISVSIDENRIMDRKIGITLEGNDADEDALTYSLVTTPINGTQSINGNMLTYNADQDWNGVETFTYKANDGELDSNISTITITVNPVNDNPVIIPDNKSLKGEHDYINLGKVINFNNNNPQSIPPNLDSWTLFFNAKIDALDENGRAVILSTGEDVQNRGLFFGIYTINGIPTLSLDYYNVDNLASGDISNIIGDGEYHSFAVLYSGSSARLLLDGVKVAENSFAANFGNENTDIWLGLSPWNNLNDLNGNIDYGAIWLGEHAEGDILDMHNGTETPGDHPTNLQGWWNFNGGNSFEDLSTNNFTATYLTNGTEGPDNTPNDCCVSLTGEHDYVNLGANIDLSNNFSIFTKMRIDGLDPDNGDGSIISAGVGSQNQGFYFYIEDNNGTPRLGLSFYGQESLLDDTIDLSNYIGDGLFHTYATIFHAPSKEARLFIDGQFLVSANFGTLFGNNNTDVYIGLTPWNSADDMNAFVDYTAIWDGAMGNNEVNELHNGQKNPLDISNGLVGYWDFDSVSTSFNDLSGNSNTASYATNGSAADGGSIDVATNEDVNLTIDLSPYVTDVDNDQLTYSISTQPSNGALAVNDSLITYSPNLNYFGTDSFKWYVNDGVVNSDTVGVAINILSINDVPVTTNQSATTVTNQALDITLTSTDIESDSITYSIVSDVSNGSTSLNGSVVTYTPNSNFSGSDSFTFKANDGTDDSNVSTVAITINNRSTKTVEISSPSSVNGNSYQVYPLNFDVNGEVVHISATVSLNGTNSLHLRYMNLLLTSPNQSRVLLMGGDQLSSECSQVGQCIGSNSGTLTNTTFNSDATTFIYNGSAPYIGSFKPNESLNTFVDEEINGEWQLHIINSNGDNIDVSNIKLDITYDADTGGTTYTEENNFVFSTSDQTNLTVNGNSTGILDIPVSLPTGKGIKDLDFELSLNGTNSLHLRYITVTVDIGNSNNAMLVFRGDQISGNGAAFGYNQGNMFKARFDDESTNGYTNSLMHAQRVEADSNSAGLDTFDGQTLTSFRIYIYNGNGDALVVSKSNTKVYIDVTD